MQPLLATTTHRRIYAAADMSVSVRADPMDHFSDVPANGRVAACILELIQLVMTMTCDEESLRELCARAIVRHLSAGDVRGPDGGAIISMAFLAGNIELNARAPEAVAQFRDLQAALPMVEAIWHGRAALHKRHHEAATHDHVMQAAHDLRSPLAALRIVADSFDATRDERIELVRLAAGRIHGIADNLLAGCRANRNVRGEKGQRASATAVLGDIVREKRLSTAASGRVTVVASDLAELDGITLRGDATQIGRVLSNILDNAIESISDEGTVSISASAAKGFVRVIVTDTGCGISPTVMSRLFQKGTSYGKENGHGLGLSGAREILLALGGTISVESRVGEGTTFAVSFPVGERS